MRKRIYLMRPFINSDEINEIKKVFNSKILTEGNQTRKFEQAIARYTQTKYAIATTSATTALHASYESLNIRNKQVFVSDFTFPATVLAIIQAGGIPILMDVEKESMNISRNIIEEYEDSKTDIISPVCLFGNSLERDFYKLKTKGYKIVEDAATNLGVKIGQKHTGSLSDITCFSFHPRKIITTGEGGMITTNNKAIYEKIKSFKMFGIRKDNFYEIGTNYKISDIQSAVGLAQLKKIEKIIKIRREKAKIYGEMIAKIQHIEPQLITKKCRHTFQSYVCYFTRPSLRDKTRKILEKNNIESQIGTYALHQLPVFKNCKKKGNLENSKFLYENAITLPLHGELTDKDQTTICKLIASTVN